MCKILASSVNPNNVTVVVTDENNQMKSYNVAKGHPKFSEIRAKVSAKDGDGLEDLINVSRAITNWGNSVANTTKGRVTVEFGKIKYAGQTIHNSLTNRILSMMDDGEDAGSLVNFLENVQCNPLESARNELFDFLEGNNLPFTTDGKFLAYKRVRHDFRDLYTGTMDNSPGKVVQLDRDTCDTNRHNTCSRGLHFASLEYARDHYGHGGPTSTDRMVITEIDPADVVSIPVDYNNQKGRTWKYKVVGELKLESLYKQDLLETITVLDTSSFSDFKGSFEDFLRQKANKQKRDAFGRFVR